MPDSKYLISLSSLAIHYGNLRLSLTDYLKLYNRWDGVADGKSATHLLKLISSTSDRIRVLEEEYSSSTIKISSEVILKIIRAKYPEFKESEISMMDFLRSFYYCYTLKENDLSTDLIMCDKDRVTITYASICAIHSERLAEQVIQEAIPYGDQLFLG